MYSAKKIVISCSYANSIINFRGKLIEGIAKRNKVVLITPQINDQQTLEKLQEWGISVFEIKLHPNKMAILSDLKYLIKLWRIIRQTRPDIFFAYTIKPICYGNFAAALCRIELVASMFTGLGFMFQNADSPTISQRLTYWLLKTGLNINKSRIVFFQNKDDRAEFLKMRILNEHCPTRIVNGSGVELERFAYQKPDTSRINFIMIARLLKSKGIREFFESASLIKKKYKNVQFHLVGEYEKNGTDSIDDELFMKIKTDQTIEYHGWVDDVRPFIINSSVMVLPSYREGVPRSILEAMAIGRPVITTDSIGCKETVVSGPEEINGFLVKLQDIESLVNKMEFFINNPDKIIE